MCLRRVQLFFISSTCLYASNTLSAPLRATHHSAFHIPRSARIVVPLPVGHRLALHSILGALSPRVCHHCMVPMAHDMGIGAIYRLTQAAAASNRGRTGRLIILEVLSGANVFILWRWMQADTGSGSFEEGTDRAFPRRPGSLPQRESAASRGQAPESAGLSPDHVPYAQRPVPPKNMVVLRVNKDIPLPSRSVVSASFLVCKTSVVLWGALCNCCALGPSIC